MYTLKDGWIAMQGSMPVENWDGKMYCTETDAELTFRTNIIQGFLAAYTFTLVIDGWLSIVYNNRELKLRPGVILYQLSHKGNPRILEWLAYPFSRVSSQPRNQTTVSCIAGGFFTN